MKWLSMVAIGVAATVTAACEGVRCGEGTVEKNGVCEAATAPAGDEPDLATAPDDGGLAGDEPDLKRGAPRDLSMSPSTTDLAGDLASASRPDMTTAPTTYTAYRAGGGPLCGGDASNMWVYCKPGDDCIDPAVNRCRSSIDGTYEAYRDGIGPMCGGDAGNHYAFCKPQDNCLDAAHRRCGAAVGGYQGYRTAGGPLCGGDAGNMWVYCLAGDKCVNASGNLCGTPTDGTYEAYRSAGGPVCGGDAGNRYTYCKPGDDCLDAATRRCQ